MFKWVHLIQSLCRIVYSACQSICNVFKCPVHTKKGDNDE